MEQMEIMKLTPDKKGEMPAQNHGGARPKIPKVQKSMTVASETISPQSSIVEVDVCVLVGLGLDLLSSLVYPLLTIDFKGGSW